MLQFLKRLEQFILKNYISVWLVFFALIFVLSVYKLYRFVYVWHDGWLLADWLINYQDGGFKRRGLSGSLFFFLQDCTGIALPVLVMSFQLMLSLLLFYWFIRHVNDKPKNLLILLFGLSPLAFGFYLYQTNAIGRKDILILLFFLLLLQYVRKNRSIWLEIFFVLAAVFIMLMHELFVFYVFYIFIIYLINQKSVNLKFIAALIAVSVVAAAIIFIFGNEINAGKSIEILKERGVERCIDHGIFTFHLYKNTSIFFSEFWLKYIGYIIPISVAFLSQKVIISSLNIASPKKLLCLFTVSFLLSIPLFYLAFDWGRWIFIHVMLSIFILNSLSQNEVTFSSFFNINNNKKASIFLILAFIYLFTWNMPLVYSGFELLHHYWFRLWNIIV